MRLPVLVVSTLLLAVFATRASGQAALTLEQAVEAALARNSTLLAAR